MEQVITFKSKPSWLKIRPPSTSKFSTIQDTLKKLNLHTVCEEAHCPNISECWSGGTATFMVMGDICTRGCRFCVVNKNAKGSPLDPLEPVKLAQAIKEWNLDYVVITSVDRDDLPDQGASHFASCIRAIKESDPNVIIEVLIPDFRGNLELLKKIVEAKPHVIAHNIETTEPLQHKVRDRRAGYRQSLSILENVKKLDQDIYTKSSVMLGLGELEEDLIKAMVDLRAINVDVFTLGQYLRPTMKHIEVAEYVTPEKFEYYKKLAETKGFLYVASGPFVRSSYKAGELFIKNVLLNKKVNSHA